MNIFKGNKSLFVIALIAVVNALGYGIIIPILYSYSQKFGLSDFQNGLLFASFSICQFVATPVIGRLSDKYGRRPLLIIAMLGSMASFVMTAFAPAGWILFIARGLDGITAGNIPVALAVISDTTEAKDRAKGFGIIGAAFGFGFIFGPAISALTVQYADWLPFIIAAVLAGLAALVTFLFLPETNKHIGQVVHGRLFDMKRLVHMLKDDAVGTTLLITLVYSTAFSMFIYGFQPFSVKVLKLSANYISTIFTLFGVVGVVTQIIILPFMTKKFGIKHFFSTSLLLVAGGLFALFLTKDFISFVVVSILLGVANSSVTPLIQTIISRETDAKSQGSIQGLNTSYQSIGQILGPAVGGILATFSTQYPFMIGSILGIFCVVFSFRVLRPGARKESAF